MKTSSSSSSSLIFSILEFGEKFSVQQVWCYLVQRNHGAVARQRLATNKRVDSTVSSAWRRKRRRWREEEEEEEEEHPVTWSSELMESAVMAINEQAPGGGAYLCRQHLDR